MTHTYNYNDLKGFSNRLHNVSSNLCAYFYKDKKQFCGNYCSRKPPHGFNFNKRCWRHKKPRSTKKTPPVVLLMISASERTYNRNKWIKFLNKCQSENVPLELVIYHEDMYNCTVRDSKNLVSRFRPFPDVFGSPLPLRNRHGSLHFAQTVLRMLEYGCKIPHASRCIVLTERTIPIRSPMKIYETALSLKCYIDISYNTAWGPVPDGVPSGPRGRPFAAVNNYCQGSYTTDFLKEALPTVQSQCNWFGISFDGDVYTVTNRKLFEQWRTFIQSNPCEFLLLNSFLLHNRHHHRPLTLLTKHMQQTIIDDKYIVTHVPHWRDNIKRSVVFKTLTDKIHIPKHDRVIEDNRSYFRGLNFDKGFTLMEMIQYIRTHKGRAMFFRQVELT